MANSGIFKAFYFKKGFEEAQNFPCFPDVLYKERIEGVEWERGKAGSLAFPASPPSGPWPIVTNLKKMQFPPS